MGGAEAGVRSCEAVPGKMLARPLVGDQFGLDRIAVLLEFVELLEGLGFGGSG